ncbi:MAG: hypothetical protein E6I64_10990 [Chloroflexi bacterium]|nr:MAG: hypothetical protein E6I64_10990 [Chloroflexota bacterium]
MRRITVLALGALLALLALGGAALAKEGAVTKFDSLPSEWHAGQNYTLGYMIRMDGVEPYKADTTEIVIRNGTGKVLSYPGTPDGTPGHYTAKVYFPAAGSYTWRAIRSARRSRSRRRSSPSARACVSRDSSARSAARPPRSSKQRERGACAPRSHLLSLRRDS